MYPKWFELLDGEAFEGVAAGLSIWPRSTAADFVATMRTSAEREQCEQRLSRECITHRTGSSRLGFSHAEAQANFTGSEIRIKCSLDEGLIYRFFRLVGAAFSFAETEADTMRPQIAAGERSRYAECTAAC